MQVASDERKNIIMDDNIPAGLDRLDLILEADAKRNVIAEIKQRLDNIDAMIAYILNELDDSDLDYDDPDPYAAEALGDEDIDDPLADGHPDFEDPDAVDGDLPDHLNDDPYADIEIPPPGAEGNEVADDGEVPEGHGLKLHVLYYLLLPLITTHLSPSTHLPTYPSPYPQQPHSAFSLALKSNPTTMLPTKLPMVNPFQFDRLKPIPTFTPAVLPKPTIRVNGSETLLTAGNIGLTPQKPLPPLPPAFTQSAPKSHSTTPASVTKVLSPTPTSLELTNEQLRSQQNTKILVGVAAGTILLLLLLR